MKISELIKILEHELNIMGDLDICISIANAPNDIFEVAGKNILSSKNITTCTDNIKDNIFEFRISNWLI